MKIKRTVAADMRAAMQIIRDTHGPDAVILSKRSVAGGIEVVSASEADSGVVAVADQQRQAPRREARRMRAHRGTVAELEDQISAATSDEKAGANRTVARAAQLLESAKAARRAIAAGPAKPADTERLAGDAEDKSVSFEQRLAQATEEAAWQDRTTIAAGVATAEDPAHESVASVETAREAPLQAVSRASAQPDARANLRATNASAEMQAELKRMRQLMSQQLAIMGWQAQVERSPASVALLRDMHALGFEASLSQRMCSALSLRADPDTNWQLARHWLSARLSISDSNPLADSGVSAVFGDAGVGKTSTVVKLAAQYALKTGPESVALISTDLDRVGGTAMLNAFANVLGVPVHAVADLDKLEQVLEDLRHRYSRVLIDTGSGQQNKRYALALADIAERCDIPMRNYVVLAADAVAGDSLELLGALGRSVHVACILTRLDAARSLGSVFSTLIEHQLPVAAVSAGTRVPDDIERVDTETLIGWCEKATAAREAASSLSEANLIARFGAAL